MSRTFPAFHEGVMIPHGFAYLTLWLPITILKLLTLAISLLAIMAIPTSILILGFKPFQELELHAAFYVGVALVSLAGGIWAVRKAFILSLKLQAFVLDQSRSIVGALLSATSPSGIYVILYYVEYFINPRGFVLDAEWAVLLAIISVIWGYYCAFRAIK